MGIGRSQIFPRRFGIGQGIARRFQQRNGPFVFARRVKDHAGQQLKARRRRRVKPQRFFDFGYRLFAAAGVGQHQGQVAGGLGIVWLDRHGPVGGIHRLRLAAVDELQQRQNGVCAGIVGVQLQGLPGRIVGDFSRHRRRPDQIVVVAPDIDRHPRDAGMGVGEIRVQIDRLLIEGQGPAVCLDVAVKEALLLGPQIVVVSFEIVGGDPRQLVALPLVQLDSQSGNDLADDVVLNREDVSIFAVVALGPQGKARSGRRSG